MRSRPHPLFPGKLVQPPPQDVLPPAQGQANAKPANSKHGASPVD